MSLRLRISCTSDGVGSHLTTLGTLTQAPSEIGLSRPAQVLMLHRNPVISSTDWRFLSVSSLRSVCSCISHFMGAAPDYLRDYCRLGYRDAFLRIRVETMIAGEMRSSRIYTSDEDPFWWPLLLGPWPKMLERSSSCH